MAGRRKSGKTLEEKFGHAGSNNRRSPGPKTVGTIPTPGGQREEAVPSVRVDPGAKSSSIEELVDPTAPQRADVTVILHSTGTKPTALMRQVEAIEAQTVQPQTLWVHIDGTGEHDSRMLNRVITHNTQVKMGPFFRLALARAARTKYVLILDEDALPGARWLEAALSALNTSDPSMNFGPAVISAGGSMMVDEDLHNNREAGPGAPRGRSLHVDYGQGGWLFDRRLCRMVESLPRFDNSRDAFGMAMAYAAYANQVPTVTLAYTADRSLWGLLEPVAPATESDIAGARLALEAYQSAGWEPRFTGKPFAEAEEKAESQSDLPSLPGLPTSGELDVEAAAAASANSAALAAAAAAAPIAASVPAPAPSPEPRAAAQPASATAPASTSGLEPGATAAVVERAGAEGHSDGVVVESVVTEGPNRNSIPDDVEEGDVLADGRTVVKATGGIVQVESVVD